MLVIREKMIDLYSGFLKKLIYLFIYIKKNENCELKWLFMITFLSVMIVTAVRKGHTADRCCFFTKILLKVQRDVKVRKHLRDISFNK